MHNATSPDTSDAGIERLIQAKGKTAPRASMGEIHPSPEFEAYSIPGIAQNLMVAYTELTQC